MASLPPLPALYASHAGLWLCEAGGEARAVSRGEAVGRAGETPVIILNAPLTGQRLGYSELSGLDLLELWAFIHPARFLVPTPKGLAQELDLAVPGHEQDIPRLLLQSAHLLIDRVRQKDWAERDGAWTAIQSLQRLRWPWAPILTSVIERPAGSDPWLFSRLPEWEERPPRPAPRPIRLAEEDVERRLALLTGSQAESRPGQRAYAIAASSAFAPRVARDRPNLVLAEAGTGIGKTLGYLAPASLWSAEAGGTVWISTYTKALQRQLDAETRRLPGAERGNGRVVVRKGRENYLCLLNLEDALQGGFAGRAAILAQLVARWAAYSKDGDMIGGDLPGWLPTLFRRNGSTALTDRRGECIYAGCPHYRKCFIERGVRASSHADIVIANHALVMVNAARGREEGGAPSRIIFDEGHHIFEAADSTFSLALSGQETIELRRWVVGPEGNSKGRRRGLAARLADVASYDAEGAAAIDQARHAASALPSEDWLKRVVQGEPFGPVETLLSAVRAHVYARSEDGRGQADAGYGLEAELAEPDGALVEAAMTAAASLDDLLKPLNRLARRLEALLSDPPDWMDGPAGARIEGAIGSLGWRTELVGGWLALLARVGGPGDPDFVDWLAVDRYEGREYDIGLHRHWIDPTRPFAETVLKPAHGVMLTSATLCGGDGWDSAYARSGAPHLAITPVRFETPSPFDYAAQAEVLIVTDIKRGDIAGLAGAYARLIEASQGGALGLFTAIRRLRAVHARIADRLARAALPLYAQHVDPIDTGTLVDIFRDDIHASLLGTDALRDGVDVPGHSLRLLIMEGVPWPKPTVLHSARRLAGGGSTYDDAIIRARLAQAFGRLIRRADDKGTFVILSAAMPSRLLAAFPAAVPIRRVTLDEAVISVSERLGFAMPLVHQADESGITPQ